jgi:hypothetical protein
MVRAERCNKLVHVDGQTATSPLNRNCRRIFPRAVRKKPEQKSGAGRSRRKYGAGRGPVQKAQTIRKTDRSTDKTQVVMEKRKLKFEVEVLQ